MNVQDENQQDTTTDSSDLALDLRLSYKDSNQGLKRELDFIDCYNMDSSQNSSDNLQGNETEPRVFSCKYCQRKFYCSQALGGHQNAHKRERRHAKGGHHHQIGASSAAFADQDSYLQGYISMASLPLHGSFFNRSHASSHIYGWSGKPPIHDQQPEIALLTPENYRVQKISPVGDGIGGYRWDCDDLKTNQEELQKLDLSLKL